MINKNKKIEIERDIEKIEREIKKYKELNTKKALKKIRKATEERGKKLVDESFDTMYSNWI